MFKRKSDADVLCPLLDRPCEERKCRFWIQILGNHPQTGEPVERWNCTFAWQPILMIENSQMQRQTGAAIESYRNEQVQGMAALSVHLGELREQHRKGAEALASMLDLAKETRRQRLTNGETS